MRKRIKVFFLTHRKSGVVISSFVGGALSLITVVCLVAPHVSDTGDVEILSFKFSEGFINNVYLIVLALPLSYYLWFLRNEDKLVQIQYQKENNHLNSFSHAVSLFTEEGNKVKNGLGLRLLEKLRKQGLFKQEIDMITSCGKDLSGVILEGVDLTGVNLKGANLKEANLIRANLEGANLMNTKLKKAKLVGTNLSEANLSESTFVMIENRFTKSEIIPNRLSDYVWFEGSPLPSSYSDDSQFIYVKLVLRDGKYYFEKTPSSNT